jgi:hypothetical protein
MVPEFWNRGTLVDPCVASPDAEYILDGEEFDWEWRLALVPVTAFGNQHLEQDKCRPGADAERERERLAIIRDWLIKSGEPTEAFKSSPLIGIWENDRLSLVDGWHRLKVAVEDFGNLEVWAIVAINPAWSAASHASPGALLP